MRTALATVLLVLFASVAHATEKEVRAENPHVVVTEKAPAASAGQMILNPVVVPQHQPAAQDATAARQMTRNWWWTVAAIVVAGVILAVLL